MKKKLFGFCLLNLVTTLALAQSPSSRTTSPTSNERSNYLLLFHSGISRLLVESISLGRPEQTLASDGCRITSAEDGEIFCLLADSCSPSFSPRCGISFSGQSGLTVADVASLSIVTSNVTPTLSANGIYRLQDGNSRKEKLEALRRQ
jgi:hypothetical protein